MRIARSASQSVQHLPIPCSICRRPARQGQGASGDAAEPRRPRADPCVSPGALGQIFRRRGRRWRARRPTCRGTRLPYESPSTSGGGPPRAAVAWRPATPSKQFGWSTLASTSVRVGAINSRGRPRPGGQERRAVAKRICWAGSGTKRCPPRLRDDRCRARIELPSWRWVHLDIAPGRATCRCNRSRGDRARPAIAAACCWVSAALPDVGPVSLDAPTPASCFARQRRWGCGTRAAKGRANRPGGVSSWSATKGGAVLHPDAPPDGAVGGDGGCPDAAVRAPFRQNTTSPPTPGP